MFSRSFTVVSFASKRKELMKTQLYYSHSIPNLWWWANDCLLPQGSSDFSVLSFHRSPRRAVVVIQYIDTLINNISWALLCKQVSAAFSMDCSTMRKRNRLLFWAVVYSHSAVLLGKSVDSRLSIRPSISLACRGRESPRWTLWWHQHFDVVRTTVRYMVGY